MTSRTESGTRLPAPVQAGTDRYGFPLVVCTRCNGRGTHSHNSVEGSRCYGCQGVGKVLAPWVAKDIVAEFAAAQRSAGRPRVRELKIGDTISRPYADLPDARFRTVARVLVATHCPTKYQRTEHGRVPVAYAAAVDFTDGTRDVVTTDFVYARRGAQVDPTPYVDRAVRRTPRR